MLYHSTPDPHINQNETISHTIIAMPRMPYVTTRERDHTHLVKPLLSLVETNTTQTPRLFIRTWYYDNPPSGIPITPIASINLDDDAELYHEMHEQRRIIPAEYETADDLINDLLQTNKGLGVRGKKGKSKILPFVLTNPIHIKSNKRKSYKVAKKRRTIRKRIKSKKKFIKKR